VKDKIRRSNWEKEVKLRITEGGKKEGGLSLNPNIKSPSPKKETRDGD